MTGSYNVTCVRESGVITVFYRLNDIGNAFVHEL
jgi:hypothetical protein